MTFQTTHVFRGERFSLGLESSTGQAYLSFPVFNGLVEYEEFYAIPSHLAADPDQHWEGLLELLHRAHRRELDAALLMPPGRLRGSPC